MKKVLMMGADVVSVSYNKLWKVLVDRKMSQAELRKLAAIAPNTMTKLRRDEDVSLSVLGRICFVLNLNIGDIMDFIPEEKMFTGASNS